MTTRARTKATLDDSFLPLDELATYSGVSRRSLETLMQDPTHPLPFYRIGGRVLVKRSEYDEWSQRYRTAPEPIDIEAAIDQKLGR